MFGVAGLMLGSGYLLEGLTLISTLLNAFVGRQFNKVLWWGWIVSLDLFTGAGLLVAGIGLLFLQRWAKTMWLWATSSLVFLHLSMIVLYQAGTDGVTAFYLIWTSMIVLLALMSWWFFTAPSTENAVTTEQV
jgi:energy-converting hydrogenase Eha subunit H